MNNFYKTAVVTGAARGIGLAIAKQFIQTGYRVAFLDKNAEVLEETRKELNLDDQHRFLICDVSDPKQVTQTIQLVIDQFHRIDALVNNAGVAVFKPALEITYEEWSHVMATNLTGPFLCTQACIPVMLKQGSGSIVNIASISGLRASTLRIAYGTSKAALAHLTKQQAVEYGNAGIRVNAVAPGPIETVMAQQVHSPEIRAAYHDAIPLKRYGSVEEIANAVLFLCSDQASYINGQVLAVDGGFEATGIGLTALRT